MQKNATAWIDEMLDFAVQRELIEREDRLYFCNLLMDAMRMDAPEEFEKGEAPIPETMTEMLNALADIAVYKGIVEDSEEEKTLFTRRLAGIVTPPPEAVRRKFDCLYKTDGAKAATDWFYEMCCACDYIRVDDVAKNVRFLQHTGAGELEITINLSKPEKDPKDIAKLAERSAAAPAYPACQLCPENVGYAGRLDFPARQNHRMVPMELAGETWHLQYSPYVYYNEHCIALSDEHRNMRISHETFVRLFAFVEKFPHYFIGSNADLPIVGGSILNHDHFQGGRYTFPIDAAKAWIPLSYKDAAVSASVVDWPMSCILLAGKEPEALIRAADEMLEAWRAHSDPALDILSETDGTPHNTITPILRRNGDTWLLQLVLRNNRRSKEHPLGIFHPHAQLHHIKKENIGLIEVMGLFILPGRLLSELSVAEKYLTGERDIEKTPDADDPVAKHYAWVRRIATRVGTHLSGDAARSAIYAALGETCEQVLKDAGVYKKDESGREGILRFLRGIGYKEA